MNDAQRTTVFVAEIDQRELQVRIMEAILEMKRPEGATAEQALAGMDADSRDASARAAIRALEYFRECIAKGQKPS